MKTSKNFQPLLAAIVLIQSVFIFMSFTSKEGKIEKETTQSYQIEKKYYNGKYFYVLVSNGEAKAFINR